MRSSPLTRFGTSLVVLFMTACSTATTTAAPGAGECDGAPCDAGISDAHKQHDSGDGGCVLDIAVMNNAACTACLQMKCCMVVNACFGAPRDAGPSDCSQLNACETACASMDAGSQQACFNGCKAAHPNSGSAETAWTECASGSCPMECL